MSGTVLKLPRNAIVPKMKGHTLGATKSDGIWNMWSGFQVETGMSWAFKFFFSNAKISNFDSDFCAVSHSAKVMAWNSVQAISEHFWKWMNDAGELKCSHHDLCPMAFCSCVSWHQTAEIKSFPWPVLSRPNAGHVQSAWAWANAWFAWWLFPSHCASQPPAVHFSNVQFSVVIVWCLGSLLGWQEVQGIDHIFHDVDHGGSQIGQHIFVNDGIFLKGACNQSSRGCLQSAQSSSCCLAHHFFVQGQLQCLMPTCMWRELWPSFGMCGEQRFPTCGYQQRTRLSPIAKIGYSTRTIEFDVCNNDQQMATHFFTLIHRGKVAHSVKTSANVVKTTNLHALSFCNSKCLKFHLFSLTPWFFSNATPTKIV